jgi:uncharacterized protein (TIGR02265 family)
VTDGAGTGAPEPTTDASAFEGMFQRALQPQGAFAEALRQAGYDAAAPRARYPSHVWRACLEVARRHVYPELPTERGYRELGLRFVEGFFSTLTGRLIGIAVAMMSPERVLLRLHHYWSIARTGVDFTLTEEAQGRWRVAVRDTHPQADYMAAVMEAALRKTGAEVRVDVMSTRPEGFEVLVHW